MGGKSSELQKRSSQVVAAMLLTLPTHTDCRHFYDINMEHYWKMVVSFTVDQWKLQNSLKS